MPENHDRPEFWIPDNPDGSGWTDIDWVSVSQGSRYHYRHGDSLDVAQAKRPRFYKVITRLETERIVAEVRGVPGRSKRWVSFEVFDVLEPDAPPTFSEEVTP